MPLRRFVPLCAVALAGPWLGGNAGAQTLPLGGRTATMGGAAVGAGDDGAMPYLNPAGYALVPHLTLSLSASLYRFDNARVPNFHFHGHVDPALAAIAGQPQLGPGSNGLVSNEFSGFPGAASILWHFGPEDDANAPHQVLGLSIIASRHRRIALQGDFTLLFRDGNDIFQDRFTSILNTDDYSFGPTYAVRLGRLRLGASGLFTYSRAARSSNSAISFSTASNFIETASASFSSARAFGFQPVFGVQWNPAGGLSVGASLAPRSIPLAGSIHGKLSAKGSAPANVVAGNYVQEEYFDGDIDRTFPTRIRLGVAYESSPRYQDRIGQPGSLERVESQKGDLTVAADVALTLAQDSAIVNRYTGTQIEQQQGTPPEARALVGTVREHEAATVSLHAGAEYFFTDMLALRIGAFYEPSPVRLELTAADVLIPQIDRVGVTGGVALNSPLGETTFGFEVAGGKGKTIAPDAFANLTAPQVVKTDMTSLSATVFIAGAVDVGEFAKWLRPLRDPRRLFEVREAQMSIAEVDATVAMQVAEIPALAELKIKAAPYMLTDVAEYDDFFKLMARLNLAVIVAHALVKEMNREIDTLYSSAAGLDRDVARLVLETWTEVRKGAGIEDIKARLVTTTGPQLPQVLSIARMIRIARSLKNVLEEFGRSLARLPQKAAELVERVGTSFTGPEALLIPAVAKNLGAAQANIRGAAREFPLLLASLRETFGRLTQKITLPDVRLSIQPVEESLRAVLGGLDLVTLPPGVTLPAIKALRTGIPEVDAFLRQIATVSALIDLARALPRQLEVMVEKARASIPARRLEVAMAQVKAAARRGLPEELPVDLRVPVLMDLFNALHLVQRASDQLSTALGQLKDVPVRARGFVEALMENLPRELWQGALEQALNGAEGVATQGLTATDEFRKMLDTSLWETR